jgi:hypothetical protein
MASPFRPQLESLTERIAPHAGPWTTVPGAMERFGIVAPPRDATEQTVADFRILVKPAVEAGAEARLMVVAVDANGRPVRDFTGTVSFASSDDSATLPESYTFTESDRGRKVFTVTLATAGEQTIAVTSADGTIDATATIDVVAPAVATGFAVTVERAVYVGAETRVLVAAVDAEGKPVRSFTGTVSLASTDAAATLPEAYAFTAADRGVHVFTFTAGTTGEQTVTATDDSGDLTGEATVTVAEAPAVAKIVAVARPVGRTGSTVAIYLVAVDANNRPVPTYSGTVNFTSESSGVTLPESYTFTAADRGVKAFEVTLPATAGEVTIVATDAANDAFTASTTIRVVDSLRGRGFGFGR